MPEKRKKVVRPASACGQGGPHSGVEHVSADLTVENVCPARSAGKQPAERALSSKCALLPGQLVRSLAGRDKGRYYLVLAIDTAGFAWVADGRTRPAVRPKRKNPCHMQAVNRVAADLTDSAGIVGIRDEQIRAAISHMLRDKEG